MVPNHFIFGYQINYISNDTGKSLIIPVPECVYAYHMSIMIQKSSPFIETFNFILQRSVESGIISHQYKLSMWELSMAYIQRSKAGHIPERQVHLLGMKELQSMFMYYVVAMIGSIVVFVGELFWGRRQRKQHRQTRTRPNHKHQIRILINT